LGSGAALLTADDLHTAYGRKESEQLSIANFLRIRKSSSVALRRKEEAKDAVEARGPGVLIVQAVGDAKVAEVRILRVRAIMPALLKEATVKEISIAEVAKTFRGAHVEPDTEIGPDAASREGP
jgi:hypothetical protein